MSILDEIILNSDEGYRAFHSRLVPRINNIIGLRGPKAKAIAKKYAGTPEGEAFLKALPHTYYDENLVHGYMLGFLNEATEDLKKRVIDFLPYVDNWAVCDSMVCGLKRLFKEPYAVWDFVLSCLKSEKAYTVRFGIVSMLSYYINEDFIDIVIKENSKIKSEEYYVKMAVAWLFSVCLVKEYEKTIPVIENRLLDKWTHNKAIQKSIESYRITDERKQYLKSLKIR